jgi:formate dehydrogenase major subunit
LQDLQNSDFILIQGSSMAEAHPVGFRWVMKAKERGARIIHVDPRFSRTSQLADRHVPIRAGTDIAFLGGLIRHVIETDSYFREYVIPYTNAATIVGDEFQDTEDLDGLFSGFDPETGMYDVDSWRYKNVPPDHGSQPGVKEHQDESFAERTSAGMDSGLFERDETLQDPRCVFQIMRRHFSRYTPEMVQRVCGIAPEDFQAVADALVANSGPERTSMICYAVGWTHHTNGVQMIRAASILQCLLGNIGRPGGGIMALRGHASIQGSTDIPTLYDILPG